ncbi:uncharacterized protein LOC112085151 [Eutrema salsugineum]|uniref:uncharacterized protein LOC112085151 n=1 Tax=Eutrema salsugineum TaxID=72664 RepID=UPI000CED7CF9|nr:uncharacterized protein LOC112085151 [Eutrema salsugineum]
MDWVKCNTDAALSNANNSYGIGWVLRDHTGNMLWMGARKIPVTRTVLEAEVEAMRWAMLVLSNFNYKRIIFESDSKTLVDSFSEKDQWPSLQPVIQDIHNLLGNFNDHKLAFYPREGNDVADRIAKETLSFTNYVPKLYSSLPNWIKPFVEVDHL